MERDSRNNTNNTGSSTFSYSARPSWIDRLEQMAVPQHSTSQGASPLDLPSAIARELQRSSTAPPGWQHTWRSSSAREAGDGALQQQLSVGAFPWQDGNPNGSGSPSLSHFYIPRFEEALGPAGSAHHHPTGMQEYSTESRSLASAEQGFFSRPSGFSSQMHGREDSGMRAAVCLPWIERMMQADVTPTPCSSLGISTSLSLAQRAVGDVSCLASASLDVHSDLQQWSETQSMCRGGFHCDSFQQRESNVELSADMCTDDEELDTHPIDDRRKKRMLSNRASAQRSRQRRQERLDQLEVLTAQLRVENSTLQKKLNSVVQVAKKLEGRNSNLLVEVDKLTKEMDRGTATKVVPAAASAAFDECEISQQTTCASSCKMFRGWTSVDPTLMRDGNVNDGASSPSMSAGSPGCCPSGSRPNESDVDFESSKAEVSPLRRSFSVSCRVGKKRSFGETDSAGVASVGDETCLAPSQPSRSRPSLTGGGGFPEASAPFASSFGLDLTSEADRWLEFSECFK